MRISLEAFQRVRKGQKWRSLALLAVGVPGLMFSSFWVFLGVLMLFVGPDEHGMSLWETRAAVAVVLLFGCLPFSICAFMTWRGVHGQLRLRRFENLLGVVQQNPGLESSQAANLLRMPPAELARTAADASTLGFASELDDPGMWMEGDHRSQSTGARSTQAAVERAPDGSYVGAVLGRNYRIEGLLGSGAMGDVYEARHVRSQRRYAVKIMRRDLRLSEDAVRRFEREAMAANRIGHPNIVAVHDYDQAEDGTRFMVMDLLEGETLQSRLAKLGQLPWHEAQTIALQVGGALAAAHDQQLIHRDMKPGNIFLEVTREGDQRAMVLDFGLVKPVGDKNESRITATGAAVGTPMYMAPEQARGMGEDQRTDVYGLAAVIYEMVTGAPPFMDQTLASVYARLLTEDAPAPSSLVGDACPPGLDQVLAFALSKDPAQRYANMRDFMNALGSLSVPAGSVGGRRTA